MDTGAADPFAPGRRIGPYHLLREIGRGGMGRVLLARDTATGDREVAFKVLLADTTHRPLLEARFQREIRNLARLRHPGIVTIFCAGSFAGHPYLVMDHLAGRDLREYLAEIASLPEDERVTRVTATLADVARAVEHAHASGVVHRDIKPSNVRVTRDGDVPVLLDFGISKCLDDLGLTGIEMPGTALYMAPEQVDVRLRASEHLIDVWALGVTLYVALTGRAPFDGDSALALSHDVLHAEPEPPSRLNPAIPPALEAAVLGCLVKDARERIPSAGALADLLDAAIGTGIAARPAPMPLAPDVATMIDAGGVDDGSPVDVPLEESATMLGSDATAFAATAWSAWPVEPEPTRPWRDVAARVALALACLVLLAMTRDLRISPSGRSADAATGSPRTDAKRDPADDPRLRAMLADDDRLARSVLLYTSDVAGPSRRALLGALRALRQGRPDAALPALASFVRDNPGSTLAPLARFWSATVMLASGRAGEARDAYDAIVTAAPRSSFAPRALLLEASAARALGDRATHDRLLARLAADYPGSDAARAAAEPLPLA
ncbi:MAG: protein kinase [Candidatus Binatia bacterium]